MGTEQDENSETDVAAVNVVRINLEGADWNLSTPDRDKVGLDMLVNMMEDQHPVINFYLQIKGTARKTRKGKKQPLLSRAATLDKPIELEHLAYYMKLPVPVFLVVVDVAARAAYYVHIQRYVTEDLNDDDWRDRLRAYKVARQRKQARTKPTKTIRVPISNVLSDTATFKEAVHDANGFMASLSVEQGIAFRERSLATLDERFEVTYLKNKNRVGFQIDAKEPVELKLGGKISKNKLDDLFLRGVPVSFDPGELTVQGSPLWQKIASEATWAHLRYERKGFINIVRLDTTDKPVARIDYLHCDVEGGQNEWRFKVHLPSDLATLEFSLDLNAMRANVGSRFEMKSTFRFRSNLTAMQGRALQSLKLREDEMAVFCGITDATRYRIDVALEGIGSIGGFNGSEKARQLFDWIGTLYGAIDKAKAIATFFRMSPRVPAKLSAEDLMQIDLLYDLIQGCEVPNGEPFDEVTVWFERDRLALAQIGSAAPIPSDLTLKSSNANLPFLGETVHVDNLIYVVTNARLITRRSDIKRLLTKRSKTAKLRFATTPESKHTLKLIDLSKLSPP